LPPRQTQRPDRACGDRSGSLLAAPNRSQLRFDAAGLSGGEVHGVGMRRGTRTGRPRVAHLATEPSAPVVADHQTDVDRLAEAGRCRPESVTPQGAGAGRQPGVKCHS
jgi:hypothetical protein